MELDNDALLGVEANKGKWSAQIFRRGQKKELFDDTDEGSIDEIDELKGKLRDLQAVWELPRSGKDFSAAIWRPEHGCAEMVLQKGKLFSHMGFAWGKKLYLHIEEALYLIDRANLMLFEDLHGEKRLLSLQEAQELMIGTGVPMDHYLVYCKLMRAGYIVTRYPSRWVLKASESPKDIWSRHRTSDTRSLDFHRNKDRRLSSQIDKSNCATLDTKSKEESELGHYWDTHSSSWLQGALPRLEDLPRCCIERSFKDPIHYPNFKPLGNISLGEKGHKTSTELPDSIIQYSIYPANSQFSRKEPGKPKFVMSICAGESSPSLSYLQKANQMSSDVPIRFVSVENGDIAIYAIAQAQLPPINKMWRFVGQEVF